MFLSFTPKLADIGKDYAVLIDYGSEGIAVHSQHETISEAIQAMNENGHQYGSPMAIVKICRIQDLIEIN
jgi:hypothetical protein